MGCDVSSRQVLIRLRMYRHELRRNVLKKSRETYSVSLDRCVGYELFFRAVASQVFLPLQRLTSVFGMGTGGPTALKTLTCLFELGFRFARYLKPTKVGWCTSGDSNPGPTD